VIKKIIEDLDIQASYFPYGEYHGWILKNAAGEFKIPGKRLSGHFDSGVVMSKSCIDMCYTSIGNCNDFFLSKGLELSALLERELPTYNLLEELHRNIYGLLVLRYLGAVLEDMKTAEGILPISDFNHLVSAIVAESPAPYIYERVGERYNHFLIDEFQDTSVLQWQNFVPLLENGLSKGNFSMVVGDGKQSIYRFRNGEVQQFQQLPKLYLSETLPWLREKEAIFERNYELGELKVNRRSSREIVQFNNELFRRLSDSFLGNQSRPVYSDLEQDFHKPEGGWVNLHVLELAESSEERRILSLKASEQYIRQAKEDGFAWKDIAVLCDRKLECEWVASHLIGVGIPVITADSLKLVEDEEVAILLAALRLRSDNTNLEAGISFVRLWLEAQDRGAELHEVLSRFRKYFGKGNTGLDIAAFLSSEGLADILDINEQEGLFEGATRICKCLEFSSCSNVFLDFFLDQIHLFSRKSNDITRFLRWWDESGDGSAVRMSEGIDAVQIMTVHKSKGLQFPVVIYPFTSRHQVNHFNPVWIRLHGEVPGLPVGVLPDKAKEQLPVYQQCVDEENEKALLDKMNALYVAFTRAENRLIVLLTPKGRPPASWIFSALASMPFMVKTEIGYELGSRGPYAVKCKDILLRSPSYSPIFNGSQALRKSLEAPRYWDTEWPTGKKDKGSIYHEILRELRSPNDLTKVLQLAAMRYCLSENEQDKAGNVLAEFLKLELAEVWFNPGSEVYAEKSFLDAEGGINIPDRFVVRPEAIWVIDFKTGFFREKYKEQLQRYAFILEAVYGKPVRAFAGMLFTPEIVEVELTESAL
jgi:ATP-dependent exoDNAse (exonuclease V) beta subunit